jgi:hypothetical protein
MSWRTTGAVVAVVLGVLGGACSSPTGPHVALPDVILRLDQDHAPLQAPGHDGVSARADVHQPVSFGPLVLTNTTGQPITIEAVAPGRRDAGLRYLGVRASDNQARRVFSLGAAPGAFPYASASADWRTAAGVVVRPEHGGGARGVEILVGLAADRPGRWALHDVSVTYRIGSQSYVTTYGDTYTVCAPKTVADCDPIDPS